MIRVHLDLRLQSGMTLEEEQARLLGLGVWVVRFILDKPANSHWIMQDPEGNVFCLVEPSAHEERI